MKIELRDNGVFPNVKDIFIRKDNKTLKLFYGGNGDLYFDIYGQYDETEEGYTTYFEIDKEDTVYPYFKSLLQSIREAEVYTPSEAQMELIDDPCEFHELVEHYKKQNKELKGCYPHTELVKDGMIEFYSDSIYNEKANRMTMKEIDGKIRFDFFDNPEDYIDGFGIRICNSGSKYMPFNICFMRFFNKLGEDLIVVKNENFQKKMDTI